MQWTWASMQWMWVQFVTLLLLLSNFYLDIYIDPKMSNIVLYKCLLVAGRIFPPILFIEKMVDFEILDLEANPTQY